MYWRLQHTLTHISCETHAPCPHSRVGRPAHKHAFVLQPQQRVHRTVVAGHHSHLFARCGITILSPPLPQPKHSAASQSATIHPAVPPYQSSVWCTQPKHSAASQSATIHPAVPPYQSSVWCTRGDSPSASNSSCFRSDFPTDR